MVRLDHWWFGVRSVCHRRGRPCLARGCLPPVRPATGGSLTARIDDFTPPTYIPPYHPSAFAPNIMLRLLRRSNSNRSNCAADTVVIPNVNHDRSRGSVTNGSTINGSTGSYTAITINSSASNSTTGSAVARPSAATKTTTAVKTITAAAAHNRYSMVESCVPSAAARAKDFDQHPRYRPHSQARRLRKTKQVRSTVLNFSFKFSVGSVSFFFFCSSAYHHSRARRAIYLCIVMILDALVGQVQFPIIQSILISLSIRLLLPYNICR